MFHNRCIFIYILIIVFYIAPYLNIYTASASTNNSVTIGITTIDELSLTVLINQIDMINPQTIEIDFTDQNSLDYTGRFLYYNGAFRITKMTLKSEVYSLPTDVIQIDSISQIKLGHTDADALDSFTIYRTTENEMNHTKDIYIYDNCIRYHIHTKDYNGKYVITSIEILDHSAALEMVFSTQAVDLTVENFSDFEILDTTFEELTSRYPVYYSYSYDGFNYLIYTLSDGSHISYGFYEHNGEQRVVNIFLCNFEKEDYAPSCNARGGNTIPDDFSVLKIGIDTEYHIFSTYKNQKLMESSNPPYFVLKKKDGTTVNLYFTYDITNTLIAIEYVPPGKYNFNYNVYGNCISEQEKSLIIGAYMDK